MRRETKIVDFLSQKRILNAVLAKGISVPLALTQTSCNPYIGITGFMHKNEVEMLLQSFASQKYGYSRQLMVGVLVSSKTLAGGTNKYPHRYPRISDAPEVFMEHPCALNIVHYNTDHPERLISEQLTAVEACFVNAPLHGFQLNISWPDPAQLALYRIRNPQRHIILQVGSHAMESCRKEPRLIAHKLCEYEGLADYILIDASGGRGTPLDKDFVLRVLNSCHDRHLDRYFRFGIAGGLYSASLGLIKPILREFPSLSIDAEGKLRDENDDLSIEKSTAYLNTFSRIFTESVA